eukprot:gene1071-10590_t
MKYLIVLIIFFIFITTCSNSVHSENRKRDYYRGIDPRRASFKDDLHTLISKTHSVISYGQIWNVFNYTDISRYEKCKDEKKISDIYSSKCWSYGRREQNGEQCGNFRREGDCYNREHSWPISWWNTSKSIPAYTDLHHIFPTDGYVNSVRASFILDDVVEPIKFRASNGAKLGRCKNYKEKEEKTYCFEPTNDVKGDFARTYFYMSIRYYKEFICCNREGIDKWKLKNWLVQVLKRWNVIDPVDEFEKRRNEIIFKVQKNRNPFVDNPGWIHLLNFEE